MLISRYYDHRIGSYIVDCMILWAWMDTVEDYNDKI